MSGCRLHVLALSGRGGCAAMEPRPGLQEAVERKPGTDVAYSTRSRYGGPPLVRSASQGQ
jgi:hypothetical protein